MTVWLLDPENWPRPALLALRSAGLDVESVAEQMLRATDSSMLRHTVSSNCWLLTYDRAYGEQAFARAAPLPPAIVYLPQGAFTPDWPAQVVLDLLPGAAWVHGHRVVVSGCALRRHALPST